jgi:methylenetetrahydrofolate reductase (NADPH)
VDSANEADDLKWLKAKCDAGADFILTQLFYDVEGFEKWVGSVRESGMSLANRAGVG